MVQYRYFFADLLTNQIQAELPLTAVNFSQALNAGGALQGSVLLSGLPAAQTAMVATVPGRSALYVDRDGVLVWGGIIWNRTYNSTSQRLSLSAGEFETYFNRRRIVSNATFSNTDQLTVAQSLINTAQAATNGNIGVIVPTNVSGFSIRSLTFYGYQQKTVLSALQDLAKAGSGMGGGLGFDFSIDVAYDASMTPTKTLNLGYPRLGNAYSSTSTTVPVFEFPAGNVLEYEYPEDGSLVANTIYATGGGSNEGKLIYSATDSTKLASGWPLLEDSSSYSDINDASLIQNLAAGQVAAVSYPPTVLKIIANPSLDPILGAYRVGDDARVRILDDRFPNGLDATYRITALNVTPGETGPERVTVTLSLPTS
jgi:hypothetical protein